MHLLTIFELASRDDDELHILFRQTAQELARSEPGSADRRNALATLDNISRVLTQNLAP